MMRYIWPLVGLCSVAGCIFALYQSGYMVIIFPQYFESSIIYKQKSPIKKHVKLFCYEHNQWKHEKVVLIWTESCAENLVRLINAWLHFLQEEVLGQKKLTVDCAIINNTTAYVSFDRKPFAKQSNIYTKWIWIESLLKTIRENELNIEQINFLVQHCTLTDTQLDFDNSWPIAGFLKNDHLL